MGPPARSSSARHVMGRRRKKSGHRGNATTTSRYVRAFFDRVGLPSDATGTDRSSRTDAERGAWCDVLRAAARVRRHGEFLTVGAANGALRFRSAILVDRGRSHRSRVPSDRSCLPDMLHVSGACVRRACRAASQLAGGTAGRGGFRVVLDRPLQAGYDLSGDGFYDVLGEFEAEGTFVAPSARWLSAAPRAFTFFWMGGGAST